ncbi:MAG: hypothetical protein M0Z54_08305, partial [Thermaerobacter sp.]|nr:hypothetical protein [Thermaerobacter sp.]
TAFLSQVLSAWAKSPAWAESLVLVLWDDWGGYVDHVPPPVVECVFWPDLATESSKDWPRVPVKTGHRF